MVEEQVSSLQRVFDMLARQSHARFANVSEQLPVPSLQSDSLYVFNSESTLSEPRADGTQLLIEKRFLVPTDEIYEAMDGGAFDIPAGGASRTLISSSGTVTARADMTVTEFVVPASDGSGGGTAGNQTQMSIHAENTNMPAAGNTSSNATFSNSSSAVVTRTRVLVTLYKLPADASVSGGADDESGGVADPGALLSAATDMAASLSKLSIDAIYPGKSYSSFISGWKGQLEDNRRRRRRVALQALEDSLLASSTEPATNATSNIATNSSLAHRRRMLYWNKVNMYDQYRNTWISGREFGVGVYLNRWHGISRWNSREFEAGLSVDGGINVVYYRGGYYNVWEYNIEIAKWNMEWGSYVTQFSNFDPRPDDGTACAPGIKGYIGNYTVYPPPPSPPNPPSPPPLPSPPPPYPPAPLADSTYEMVLQMSWGCGDYCSNSFYTAPSSSADFDMVVSWTWAGRTYNAGKGLPGDGNTVFGGDSKAYARTYEYITWPSIAPPPATFYLCLRANSDISGINYIPIQVFGTYKGTAFTTDPTLAAPPVAAPTFPFTASTVSTPSNSTLAPATVACPAITQAPLPAPALAVSPTPIPSAAFTQATKSIASFTQAAVAPPTVTQATFTQTAGATVSQATCTQTSSAITAQATFTQTSCATVAQATCTQTSCATITQATFTEAPDTIPTPAIAAAAIPQPAEASPATAAVTPPAVTQAALSKAAVARTTSCTTSSHSQA
ncbi:hypothetical protein HXX76_002025 [Chlamydomonas incerta]|uniref:Uncharacterized protein n=1 Tax=Chlamydomonas incerta TaxID=51695 RepID=A0A836B080_CHLIN|nr:hypothetical protein HXX76_002025 [Chlamydomonas incerta]|eukprot:KAG2443677.1 hypothetical protein HXX76_002025 [Chlamydomonas incerta]